jgi:signal transduction histidine kinase
MRVSLLDEVPRLGVAAFRNRIVFHLVFVLLALATLALAVALLNEEKQRNAQRYEQGFKASLGELAARLRHPAGQLALLNPEADRGEGLAPLLLPFGAIDFDDATKAQRAVEMSGCAWAYPGDAKLCAAVGSRASAGAFVYLTLALDMPPLAGRERGALDLAAVHRVRIELDADGSPQQWLAPLELLDAQRGQLVGFAGVEGDELPRAARPQRDFRGWWWREGPCLDGAAAEPCPKRAFVSLRLPVEAYRAAAQSGTTWPPAELPRTQLRLSLLGPEGMVFDSARPGATPPLSLGQIGASLGPGETLRITRLGRTPQVIATQRGADDSAAAASPWLTALIRRLPATRADPVLAAREVVSTPAGRFEIELRGDLRALDRPLSATATRLAWPVGAMLAAIGLAWLIIEMGLIRRVATLTKRAAAVAYNVQAPQAEARLGELDVSDLRGRDELGILAGSLADLLQRVKDGLRLEALRAEREREMWHAVGHEIMSPLQSLLALHGRPEDASHRYVQRMQQAVRVLYGHASPSEALAAAPIDVEKLDLDAFLALVAEGSAHAGIEGVAYAPLGQPTEVLADAFALEDALTHVLQNAARYRRPGSAIQLALRDEGELVALLVHNEGPPIAVEPLERIFEYGVSDAPAGGEQRGQGLFVAKTYLAKMGGSIAARNEAGGVTFEIQLRRA